MIAVPVGAKIHAVKKVKTFLSSTNDSFYTSISDGKQLFFNILDRVI